MLLATVLIFLCGSEAILGMDDKGVKPPWGDSKIGDQENIPHFYLHPRKPTKQNAILTTTEKPNTKTTEPKLGRKHHIVDLIDDDDNEQYEEQSPSQPLTSLKARNFHPVEDKARCMLSYNLQDKTSDESHARMLKQEISKLQDLVQVLRDQQYILNMLSDVDGSKKETLPDLTDEKQHLIKQLKNFDANQKGSLIKHLKSLSEKEEMSAKENVETNEIVHLKHEIELLKQQLNKTNRPQELEKKMSIQEEEIGLLKGLVGRLSNQNTTKEYVLPKTLNNTLDLNDNNFYKIVNETIQPVKLDASNQTGYDSVSFQPKVQAATDINSKGRASTNLELKNNPTDENRTASTKAVDDISDILEGLDQLEDKLVNKNPDVEEKLKVREREIRVLRRLVNKININKNNSIDDKQDIERVADDSKSSDLLAAITKLNQLEDDAKRGNQEETVGAFLSSDNQPNNINLKNGDSPTFEEKRRMDVNRPVFIGNKLRLLNNFNEDPPSNNFRRTSTAVKPNTIKLATRNMLKSSDLDEIVSLLKRSNLRTVKTNSNNKINVMKPNIKNTRAFRNGQFSEQRRADLDSIIELLGEKDSFDNLGDEESIDKLLKSLDEQSADKTEIEKKIARLEKLTKKKKSNGSLEDQLRKLEERIKGDDAKKGKSLDVDDDTAEELKLLVEKLKKKEKLESKSNVESELFSLEKAIKGLQGKDEFDGDLDLEEKDFSALLNVGKEKKKKLTAAQLELIKKKLLDLKGGSGDGYGSSDDDDAPVYPMQLISLDEDNNDVPTYSNHPQHNYHHQGHKTHGSGYLHNPGYGNSGLGYGSAHPGIDYGNLHSGYDSGYGSTNSGYGSGLGFGSLNSGYGNSYSNYNSGPNSAGYGNAGLGYGSLYSGDGYGSLNTGNGNSNLAYKSLHSAYGNSGPGNYGSPNLANGNYGTRYGYGIPPLNPGYGNSGTGIANLGGYGTSGSGYGVPSLGNSVYETPSSAYGSGTNLYGSSGPATGYAGPSGMNINPPIYTNTGYGSAPFRGLPQTQIIPSYGSVSKPAGNTAYSGPISQPGYANAALGSEVYSGVNSNVAGYAQTNTAASNYNGIPSSTNYGSKPEYSINGLSNTNQYSTSTNQIASGYASDASATHASPLSYSEKPHPSGYAENANSGNAGYMQQNAGASEYSANAKPPGAVYTSGNGEHVINSAYSATGQMPNKNPIDAGYSGSNVPPPAASSSTYTEPSHSYDTAISNNQLGQQTAVNTYNTPQSSALPPSNYNTPMPTNYAPLLPTNYKLPQIPQAGLNNYNPPPYFPSTPNYNPQAQNVYNPNPQGQQAYIPNLQGQQAYLPNPQPQSTYNPIPQLPSNYMNQDQNQIHPNYEQSNHFFHAPTASAYAAQYPQTPQDNYKEGAGTYAASAAEPYANPQQNPDAYTQAKVTDLKHQIYELQAIISTFNKPEYLQNAEDKMTVYKLDKQINDLKAVINNLTQDYPNSGTSYQNHPQTNQGLGNQYQSIESSATSQYQVGQGSETPQVLPNQYQHQATVPQALPANQYQATAPQVLPANQYPAPAPQALPENHYQVPSVNQYQAAQGLEAPSLNQATQSYETAHGPQGADNKYQFAQGYAANQHQATYQNPANENSMQYQTHIEINHTPQTNDYQTPPPTNPYSSSLPTSPQQANQYQTATAPAQYQVNPQPSQYQSSAQVSGGYPNVQNYAATSPNVDANRPNAETNYAGTKTLRKREICNYEEPPMEFIKGKANQNRDSKRDSKSETILGNHIPEDINSTSDHVSFVKTADTSSALDDLLGNILKIMPIRKSSVISNFKSADENTEEIKYEKDSPVGKLSSTLRLGKDLLDRINIDAASEADAYKELKQKLADIKLELKDAALTLDKLKSNVDHSGKRNEIKRSKREIPNEENEALTALTSLLGNLATEDEPPRQQSFLQNPVLDDVNRRIEAIQKQLEPGINQYQSQPQPGHSIQSEESVGNPRKVNLFNSNLLKNSVYSNYPAQSNYNYAQVMGHDVNSNKRSMKLFKKDDIFDGIFEKILDKILSKVSLAFPKIIELLFGPINAQQDYNGSYYNGNYQVQNFQNWGLSGLLPMILIKILSKIQYFFNYLQKFKFFKTFLIPALILLLVAGSIIFLVWWLQPNDEHAYQNLGYSGGGNYNPIGYPGVGYSGGGNYNPIRYTGAANSNQQYNPHYTRQNSEVANNNQIQYSGVVNNNQVGVFGGGSNNQIGYLEGGNNNNQMGYSRKGNINEQYRINNAMPNIQNAGHDNNNIQNSQISKNALQTMDSNENNAQQNLINSLQSIVNRPQILENSDLRNAQNYGNNLPHSFYDSNKNVVNNIPMPTSQYVYNNPGTNYYRQTNMAHYKTYPVNGNEMYDSNSIFANNKNI